MREDVAMKINLPESRVQVSSCIDNNLQWLVILKAFLNVANTVGSYTATDGQCWMKI